jgi:hypothetical protein
MLAFMPEETKNKKKKNMKLRSPKMTRKTKISLDLSQEKNKKPV